jgi:hypothetical protein
MIIRDGECLTTVNEWFSMILRTHINDSYTLLRSSLAAWIRIVRRVDASKANSLPTEFDLMESWHQHDFLSITPDLDI